jgi:aromatic ring-opening dioxygenase LigB subunit
VGIVVGCPARDLTRQQLVDIGDVLVATADAEKQPVALIVSADQGHGHATDGPFGYSPLSAQYDDAMQAAIRDNDLERLLVWDDDWIDEAMPDSYWQTLALIGVRRRLGWRTELLAYDIDHYFGLMCAELRP